MEDTGWTISLFFFTLLLSSILLSWELETDRWIGIQIGWIWHQYHGHFTYPNHAFSDLYCSNGLDDNAWVSNSQTSSPMRSLCCHHAFLLHWMDFLQLSISSIIWHQNSGRSLHVCTSHTHLSNHSPHPWARSTIMSISQYHLTQEVSLTLQQIQFEVVILSFAGSVSMHWAQLGCLQAEHDSLFLKYFSVPLNLSH